jgi:hypothetical protein
MPGKLNMVKRILGHDFLDSPVQKICIGGVFFSGKSLSNYFTPLHPSCCNEWDLAFLRCPQASFLLSWCKALDFFLIALMSTTLTPCCPQL